METDRAAVLTVRAAARGLLDFSKADIHSTGWWRRSNLVIREIGLEEEREVLTAAYMKKLALVASANVSPDDFKVVQEGAYELFIDILNRRQPWMATSVEMAQMAQINNLVEAYKQQIGDPNDPVFMRRLEESMAADREKRNRRRVDPEEMLQRRIEDRDRKIRERLKEQAARRR